MSPDRIVCREPAGPADPMLQSAERLYEQTLAADERIPWVWIERAVADRDRHRPGGWRKHLLLAAPEADPGNLLGYAYGAFLPGYGGYLCYLGVAEAARKRGVGTKLMDEFARLMEADARTAGEPLPFVVWESHRPTADDPAAAWKLWDARVRLFDRVGGRWVAGLDFLSPNFADPAGPPVPLQLFVQPVAVPAAAFDAAGLRRLAAGLLTRVYREQPGSPLYDGTLATAKPRLLPATAAGRAAVCVL